MSRQQRITAVFTAVFGDTMPTKLVPRLARLTELAGAFVDACEMGEPKALSPSAVRTGIDWDAEVRLGKIPDGTLARLLGVSVATVRSARVVRSIPLYRSGQDLPVAPAVIEPPARRGPGRPPQGHIDWAAETRLGAISDNALSMLLNVNRKSVARARIKLGKPAFRETKAKTSEVSA